MPRNKISNRLLAILSVAAASLVLLVVATALNPPATTGSIYSNMYIHGIPVGGLTPDEAHAALMQIFQPSLDTVAITFSHEGQTITQRTYKDLGIQLDFSDAISSAIQYSNRRNLPSRIARMLGRPAKITEPPTLRMNQEKITSQLQYIAKEVQTPATNAGFSYNNGQITITPEASGLSVDTETAISSLNQLISTLSGGNVEMQTSTLPPVFTTADMQFTVSNMSSFSTPITTGTHDPRVRNIQRASDRIHNQMLYPGEVFSASALIGSHLPGNEYEAAIVLVRGEPVEDIGGGICQVVTTLYNAILLAELTVVQRHNHSARVSYADYGFDATIAGDYYDLKFKNNTPHPILIVSQLSYNNLTVTIHGKDDRPPNRSLQFSSRRVDVIPPEPYKEVIDQDLPPGERVVILESQMGYRYEVFKHIFIDGQEVEEIKINTSSYRPLQGIISIGASE
ncbi:MAG: VanW family protein [Defluviitaleaceae bacterium]|nr:VanW family protein [Defluviitaleaceae bacterium]